MLIVKCLSLQDIKNLFFNLLQLILHLHDQLLDVVLIGFIAQEMGREINTLGSKANESNMQILVVKMKDELEKIKEQVLNIL